MGIFLHLIEKAWNSKDPEMVKLMTNIANIDKSDANGSTNPFGPAFGTIYKQLDGDLKKRADESVKKIVYDMHKT